MTYKNDSFMDLTQGKLNQLLIKYPLKTQYTLKKLVSVSEKKALYK